MNQASYVKNQDVISFSELFDVLWRWKFLIISIVLISACLSALYAIKQPDIYRAEVIAALPSDSNSGGLSNLGGQLGGLASLAGVSLGGKSEKVLEQAKSILRSRSFLQYFIDKYELQADIIAAKGWDQLNNQLIYNQEIYNPESGSWNRTPPPGRPVEPTAWEAYPKLLSWFTIEVMPKKGMLRLVVDHYSPYIAKHWVELLLHELNELYRAKSQQEAQDSIAYLEKAIEETELVSVRKVFYDLLEEQRKSDMLTHVRKEFALETLVNTVLPEEKNHPSRAFICIIGTFIGGLFSIILAFVANFFVKKD